MYPQNAYLMWCQTAFLIWSQSILNPSCIHCIHFSLCFDKMLDECNFKKVQSSLAHSFTVQFTMSGKEGWQGFEAAGHVTTVIRKQRTIDADHFLISHRRSSLIQVWSCIISQAFLETSLQISLSMAEHQFHPISDSDCSQAHNKNKEALFTYKEKLSYIIKMWIVSDLEQPCWTSSSLAETAKGRCVGHLLIIISNTQEESAY